MNNDLEKIRETIKNVTDAMHKVTQKYPLNEARLDQIINFINRINPHYPLDSVDLLDMINLALNYDHVPNPGTIDILENYLKNADFTRGELNWKYKHPVLTATFYPKHSGIRYDIIFASVPKDKPTTSALSFPIKVTVHTWVDMDLNENHDADVCGMINPDHDDDCPFVKLFAEKDEPTQEEIDSANSKCECSGECYCKPFIIRTVENVFEREDFFENFPDWLLAAHYGFAIIA